MVRESHSTPRSASDASAQLGDVAYLTVTAVNSTGAFLRWGQPKDVLLPYSEQRFRPDPGKRVLVMLYSDDQGRPVATMRLDRFLTDDAWALEKGDEVDVVVIGGGQAGASLVARLRSKGFEGGITLIGAEPVPQRRVEHEGFQVREPGCVAVRDETVLAVGDDLGVHADRRNDGGDAESHILKSLEPAFAACPRLVWKWHDPDIDIAQVLDFRLRRRPNETGGYGQAPRA
mgnify:CR=1 FL=1|nr:S1-like domain-containing RNA-binding protein [uncultured Halomonas sp.]